MITEVLRFIFCRSTRPSLPEGAVVSEPTIPKNNKPSTPPLAASQSSETAMHPIPKKPPMPKNIQSLNQRQMKDAIELINTGDLELATETSLIKKVFSSLNINMGYGNRDSEHGVLNIMDILVSNGDQNMNLCSYTRAQKAFEAYIKVHRPIVDLGVNDFGQHIVDQFNVTTHPVNRKSFIFWASSHSCCGDASVPKETMNRVLPYI